MTTSAVAVALRSLLIIAPTEPSCCRGLPQALIYGWGAPFSGWVAFFRAGWRCGWAHVAFYRMCAALPFGRLGVPPCPPRAPPVPPPPDKRSPLRCGGRAAGRGGAVVPPAARLGRPRFRAGWRFFVGACRRAPLSHHYRAFLACPLLTAARRLPTHMPTLIRRLALSLRGGSVGAWARAVVLSRYPRRFSQATHT